MNIIFNNSTFSGNATPFGVLPTDLREIRKTKIVDPGSLRLIQIHPKFIHPLLCSHEEGTLRVRLDFSGVESAKVELEVSVTDSTIAVFVTGIEDPRIQMVNLVIFVPEKDFSQYQICQ